MPLSLSEHDLLQGIVLGNTFPNDAWWLFLSCFGRHHIPGAGNCGILAHDSMPLAVKYGLKGLLQGHAEVQHDKPPVIQEEACPQSTDVEAGESCVSHVGVTAAAVAACLATCAARS